MPDGTGGSGEGSGNQYGGGNSNGKGNVSDNGNFNSDQATRDAINAADTQAQADTPSAPPDNAPSNNTSSYFNNNAPAASPFAAFSQVTRSPEQQAFFDRHVEKTAARDAYTTAYQKAQEAGPVSPLDQAKLFKEFTQTTQDKWTKPATRNTEAVEHNDLKFTVNPSDLTGLPVDRAVLKAMDQVGLGGVYGVQGNENQSAQNVIAAQNVSKVLSTAIDIAKNLVPGYGVIAFAANVLSGKMTVGQAFASILGDKVASSIGVSPSVFRVAMNGDYGNGVAAWANSALNSYVAKQANVSPAVTGMLMNVTGLGDITKSMASPLNVGPNINKALAKTFDTGLQKIGIGSGPKEPSGNIPYTGTDAQSQVENIINPSGMNSSSAPSSAPLAAPATPSSPLSSAGTSSGSYAGALSNMSNLGPSGGLYRIGNAGYSPYEQDLAQLNLPEDQPTKQSDIGNIPLYNMDINKMANSPFLQSNDPYSQYAAAGGSIRHFDEGGDVAPAPTADQLEKRAALQAQAEYYKNLDAEKQNADIMSALKNLSGVGAAEAKPQSSPLIRLGQVGNYTPPKVLPQLAALLQARGMRLAEGGQPDDHKHPNYDGTPVFRTGGLSGLGGKYVEGKGDGTSDDITAMLADGEYVFSADVVSALGNGSNKAGAKALDETVQAIRARARSAPPDKLPPDAKSPLEYMQSVKGKKYG